MPISYYGAHQDIRAEDSGYPGVSTPDELYLALRLVWSRETCSPSLRPQWSKENPSLGQCSISALLAQELFGGEVYGMQLKNGAVHCYNAVGDKVFDLASEQFGASAAKLSYEGNVLIDRSVQLADADKRARYELLKRFLAEQCAKKP